MAQELQYVIRTKLDAGDVKSVRDQLNKIQQEASKPSGTSGDPKETKQFQSALDELTQAYLKNAQALVDLQEQNQGYKRSLNELAEVKRVNGQLTEEEQRVELALQTALKDTQKDYRTHQTEMIALQQQAEKTSNSYFDIQARMRALSIQIKSLDPDIAGNAEQISRLTVEYNGLNDRLKKVDSSMGNMQRNVGNYENSMRSFANTLAVFQGPLGPIAGRINALATTLTRFERSAAAGGKGARVAAVGIRLMWGAIMPLSLAIVALISYFKRTERGAQQLRVILAGFRAVLNVIADRFVALGDIIVGAIREPKEAVKGLWTAIKTFLVDRIVAVGDIYTSFFRMIASGAKGAGLAVKGIFSAEARAEAQKYFEQANGELREMGKAYLRVFSFVGDIVDAAKDLYGEVVRTVNAATALEDRMNNLLEIERALGVMRAEQNRDLQEARDMARDMSRTFEERLDALAKIRRAEEELYEFELAVEQQRLEIMQEQAKLSENKEKDYQAIADQIAKVADIERAHLERSMSLRRDENSLIRARNELLLREARRQMDAENRASTMRIASIEREMVKRGEIVELAERKIADFHNTRVREQQLLEEQYKQELINQYGDLERAKEHFDEAILRAAHEMNMRELDIKNELYDAIEGRHNASISRQMETERMARQTELNDTLAQLQLRNDQIGMLEAERAALEVEIEREKEQRILELSRQLQAQGIQEYDANKMAELAIDQEYAEKRAEIERRNNALIKANRQELMDATVALTKAGLTAVFGDSKSVSVASAIIDTLAGMNKALAMGGPAGWVNAAAIGLAGFANVRKILNTSIDSKDTSAPSMDAYRPQMGFGLVDLPGGGSRGSMESQMGGMASGAQNQSTTIILDGEFDKEALSVKVRQGNDAISSRSISIGV
jgi:hypothetical protein